MLIKTLISAVLLSIALVSNGAGPTAASSSAPGSRPVPSVPRPQIPRPLSANQAKSCVKSFIKRIRYRLPVVSVSKTSMAACRSKFGIEPQSRLMQSRKPIAKIDWPKRRIEVNATEENIRIKTEYPDENQNFRSDDRTLRQSRDS